jgi:hypothetical protein
MQLINPKNVTIANRREIFIQLLNYNLLKLLLKVKIGYSELTPTYLNKMAPDKLPSLKQILSFFNFFF